MKDNKTRRTTRQEGQQDKKTRRTTRQEGQQDKRTRQKDTNDKKIKGQE